MALISGGGASFPPQWTVGADGSLRISVAGALAGDANPFLQVVIDGSEAFSVYQETDGTNVTFINNANLRGSWFDEVSATNYTLRWAGNDDLRMNTLPTADPHHVGQLWNSAGTLKVSAG